MSPSRLSSALIFSCVTASLCDVLLASDVTLERISSKQDLVR
jgi:hypothetical protein